MSLPGLRWLFASTSSKQTWKIWMEIYLNSYWSDFDLVPCTIAHLQLYFAPCTIKLCNYLIWANCTIYFRFSSQTTCAVTGGYTYHTIGISFQDCIAVTINYKGKALVLICFPGINVLLIDMICLLKCDHFKFSIQPCNVQGLLVNNCQYM